MTLHQHGGYGAMHARRAVDQRDEDPVDFLREALEQRIAEVERTRTRFMEWALRVPEPKSGTLDFRRFPFQRELYEEASDLPQMVVKKSTQVGVSAFLLRWTMYHADRGLTALYVFPKLKQMYDFSDARIKNVILASEYLRERIPALHVQNKGLKQIGLGFVYYRGSEAVEQLDSVDADALALDEYDTLVQRNIPHAERRISGSEHPMIRRVGVPSVPEYGIARLYSESDRRRWHVRCAACGEWQYLTFGENVDQVRGIRICRKCTKPLEGDPLLSGEWVAEFPDRAARGYHVPRLIVPNVNLKQIIQDSRERAIYKKQTFFNKDLGEEYAPEEGRLSPQAIAAAQREFQNGPSDVGYTGSNVVTMGVDVASTRNLNVRISEHIADNQKRALWIGEAESFDELCNLMARFNVNMAAIDHLPDGRLARSFAERFPGRVYLVLYSSQQRDVLMVDEQQRRASVRRVEAMDATMEMVRSQRNLLPIDLPHDYVAHMQSNVRITEEDELGKLVVAYRKTSDDDYFHAEVFDLIATELWWIRQAVEESQRDVFQPLDDMLEFQRSTLNDPDDINYSPGPNDDEYHAGPDYDVG